MCIVIILHKLNRDDPSSIVWFFPTGWRTIGASLYAALGRWDKLRNLDARLIAGCKALDVIMCTEIFLSKTF